MFDELKFYDEIQVSVEILLQFYEIIHGYSLLLPWCLNKVSYFINPWYLPYLIDINNW